MTIYHDFLVDLAGNPFRGPFVFNIPFERTNAAGTKIVTFQAIDMRPLVNTTTGEFTTPALDPGPAKVQIGHEHYDITIAASGTLRLWDAIFEGQAPPAAQQPSAIVNAGDFASGRAMTAAAYATLTGSQTPSPGSMFFIYS